MRNGLKSNMEMSGKVDRRTLYVSDLDGTLLGADSRISTVSRGMLRKSIASGTLFTVATARTPATVSSILAGIDMPLPAIVMTGSALWDTRTGEYTDVKFIETETAGQIYDICRKHQLPTFIYTLSDNLLHIYFSGEMTDTERKFMDDRKYSPYKCFHINEIPAHLDNVILFYAMRPKESVEPVYRELRELNCNPVYYFDIFGPDTAILEVFSPEASKAAAVRNLANRYDAGRIMAFGDNVNDLPMLRAADIGVAVGNAIEEVKDAADEVIGINTADSVANFILDDSMGNHMGKDSISKDEIPDCRM